MKILKSSVLLVFMMFTALSCLDDPECIGLINNIVGVTFRSAVDGKATSIAVSSVVAETASDTLILDATANKILLPLDYYADQTTFFLQTADTTYRFVVGYKTQIQYVSEDCGQRYVLSGIEVEDHGFDSLRVVGTTPGVGNNANNIDIFWE